jgi:hypothetical protein
MSHTFTDNHYLLERYRGYVISTIALWCRGQTGLLETVIFNPRGQLTEYQERCGVCDDLTAMHNDAKRQINQWLAEDDQNRKDHLDKLAETLQAEADAG